MSIEEQDRILDRLCTSVKLQPSSFMASFIHKAKSLLDDTFKWYEIGRAESGLRRSAFPISNAGLARLKANVRNCRWAEALSQTGTDLSIRKQA